MSIKPLSRVLQWALLGIFAVGMGGVFLAPASLKSASFIFGLSSLIVGLLLSLSVGFHVAPRTYPAPHWRAALAVVNVGLVVVVVLVLWRSYVIENRLGRLDFSFILEGFFSAVSLLLLRGVSRKKLAEAILVQPPNQSPDPTLASGTSPAGQEPRHR
jgi:hypothetical protein